MLNLNPVVSVIIPTYCEEETIEGPDPTWKMEYEHFKELCETGDVNIEKDLWINSVLNNLTHARERALT